MKTQTHTDTRPHTHMPTHTVCKLTSWTDVILQKIMSLFMLHHVAALNVCFFFLCYWNYFRSGQRVCRTGRNFGSIFLTEFPDSSVFMRQLGKWPELLRQPRHAAEVCVACSRWNAASPNMAVRCPCWWFPLWMDRLVTRVCCNDNAMLFWLC